MPFRRSAILAALALAATAGAAAAQYYPPGPYSPYPPRGYGYGYRPAQMGYLCYTSRGTCEIGYEAPVGGPCRCHIPGFGRKRGVVQP